MNLNFCCLPYNSTEKYRYHHNSLKMLKKQISSPGPMDQVDLVQCFLRFLNPFEVIALARVSKLFQRVTHKPSTFSSSLVYTVSHDHNSGHLYCSKSTWGRNLSLLRNRTKKPNISFDSIVQTPRTNDLIKVVFIDGMNGHIRRINTNIRFHLHVAQILWTTFVLITVLLCWVVLNNHDSIVESSRRLLRDRIAFSRSI